MLKKRYSTVFLFAILFSSSCSNLNELNISGWLLLPIGLLFFIWFLYTGKPNRIIIKISNFSESFEKTDYTSVGRITTPYKAWESNKQIKIKVRGVITFKRSFLNWGGNGMLINAQIEYQQVDSDISLVLVNEDREQFGHNNPMPLNYSFEKQGAEFEIKLTKSPSANTTDIQLIKFKLTITYDSRYLLFFSAKNSASLVYQCHVGGELGNVWLAIDPGTNASCVAAGSNSNNITIEELNNEELITPSLLLFSKSTNFNNNNLKNDINYYHGYKAQSRIQNSNTVLFQSIKKLLGYRSDRTITFENGQILSFNGVLLSNLLIKHLIEDFIKYINTNPSIKNDFGDSDSVFCPQRVVVSIPNNFTAVKIQDLRNCIQQLDMFSEIRFISEAESVLCYYIYQHETLHSSCQPLKDETVLVFDMGGATINMTIADVVRKDIGDEVKYHMNILSNIGYSVGGDTIDYCLAKFFYFFADDHTNLYKINPFKDTSSMNETEIEQQMRDRKSVQSVVETLKKIIIANYYNKQRTTLLEPFDIEMQFNAIGISISVNSSGKMFSFFKKTNDEYPLFNHHIFVSNIYNPIRDIVNETEKMLDIKYFKHLDTILFSGRSCLFPLIKETVQESLNNIENIKIDRQTIELAGKELKTAVVKGACWYGVNRNAINLSHAKVNSTFGVARTRSGTKNDLEFIELIKIGTPYKEGKISKEVNASYSFNFDNLNVTFYQIVGANGLDILKQQQKHKYVKLGSIKTDFKVMQLALEVNINDTVSGYIKDETDEIKKITNILQEQDIADANEEHYTWIVN